MLNVADMWGKEWHDCVGAFIDFKRAAGFTLQEMQLPTSALCLDEFGIWFGTQHIFKGLSWENYLCKGDCDTLGIVW